MILYSEDSSPFSAVVRAAIYAKGAAIPIEPPPGGLRSDEYRALTGTGTVPCLMLDDGTPLPESTVILAYLDEKIPAPPLMPAGVEARARAALLMRLGMGGIVDALVGFFHDLSTGAPNARETVLERLTTGLARIEHFLAADGYAAGPAFSLADCVLGPALMGVPMIGGMAGAPDLLSRYPKLTAYAPRVSAHPAVAKVLAELQVALAANPLPGEA
ncbi:MAG TPA: glutathione S-transferase family protein [Caulobacteraceae bacterium]|jgi:glutathione S-transferase